MLVFFLFIIQSSYTVVKCKKVCAKRRQALDKHMFVCYTLIPAGKRRKEGVFYVENETVRRDTVVPYAPRTVLHCDCNSFFASVETALNPSLDEGPMAVCGDPEKRHGIILAKNQKAKKYGINVGEAIWQARQKCPSLTLVVPHHGLYTEYSRKINKIYQSYTDRVEPFGIDESWLDVTGSFMRFGDGKKIADEIRERVKMEVGITVSAGVSFNKVFAKLGSDMKKPDATTVISRENFRQVIFPLPASELLFVGRATSAELSRMRINTIGDLAATDRDALIRRFGKCGAVLHDYANGLEDSPVAPTGSFTQVKSVSNGFTFLHDLIDPAELRTALVALSDEVAARMRKHGVMGKTAKLFLRTNDLKVMGMQRKLPAPTNLYASIVKCVLSILESIDRHGMPIRSMTVAVSDLIDMDGYEARQVTMLAADPYSPFKREALENSIDKLRARYGKNSVVPASLLGNTLGFDPLSEKQSVFRSADSVILT